MLNPTGVEGVEGIEGKEGREGGKEVFGRPTLCLG